MALVKLMSAGSHPEAELLKGLLATEGIPCVVHGESSRTDMGTEAGFAQISLLVNEEQLDRARQLLEATAVPDEPAKSGKAPEGAVCPVHEQPATRICSRCGSYLCAGCGQLGVPPVCEACDDRLAQAPRRRSKTKVVAALLLLFLLGVPLIAAAVIQAFLR